VRRLCVAGRVKGTFRALTFEAFPNAPALRFAWRISADAPKPTLFYTRLTEAQKEEIARRARKGERRKALAREYGVTRAYVHRLHSSLLSAADSVIGSG
jgi:hypothetical protein